MKLCPKDFEEIAFFFQDRSALRQIIELKVVCPFKKQGCNWVGMIIDFIVHKERDCKFAADWETCEFSIIGCNRKGSKEEMYVHYKKDCAIHLRYFAKVLKKLHLVNVQASSFEEGILFTNKECQKKIEEDSDSILAIETSLEGLDHALKKVRLQVNALRTEQKIIEDKHCLMQKDMNLDTMLIVIKELWKNFDSLKLNIGHVDTGLDEKLVSPMKIYPNSISLHNSEAKLKNLEKERKTRRENLADTDLRIRLYQATTYDGKYVWKIDNYIRRMKEAKEKKIIELFSPPLFSDNFGYRVCCKIYLNGKPSEDGYGTHVAFYMVLMKGEFDALLRFPFPRILRATLLAKDQNYNIEKVIEPTNTEPFQMPRQEMNSPVGYNMFVSHVELATSQYLWDDALFFKIDFSHKSPSFSYYS